MNSTAHYYQEKSVVYKMNAARKQAILGLVGSGNKLTLEIGCGRGELAKALQALGQRVVGVDISSAALVVARPYLTESFCFDLSDQIWPTGITKQQFDLAIASEVIEHLFDPENFLQQLKPLLSPTGELIITTPNFLFWKNRLNILCGRLAYTATGLLDFGHIRFFSHSELRQLFQRTGFSIKKAQHFYPNLYRRGLNWLGKFCPGLLAYQFIFLLEPIKREKVDENSQQTGN